MKFSLGGKQFIEFKTDVKGLQDIAPIQKSSHFIPKWFKDMQDYIEIPAVHEKNKKIILVKKAQQQSNIQPEQ